MSELSKKVKKVTLWKVALPYLAIVIINTFSAPINTFISSGINNTAIEAISSAGSIMMMFGILLSLLSGGSGIIIGQYIGRKTEEKKLKEATDSNFIITLVQAVVVAVIITFLGPILLKTWGLQSGTQQMHDGSFYIYVLGPTMIIVGLQGYYSFTIAAYGHPKWTMFIGIGSILLDVFASSMLVYVAHIGVLGVVLGTLISRVISILISLFLYSKIVQPFWKTTCFSWSAIKQITRISVPIAGEKINYNIGQYIQGIIVGQIAFSIGLYTLGHNLMLQSRGIFMSISAVTLIGSVAMSIGVETVVSRLLGEGDYKKAKKIVFKAYLVALAIDIPMALIVFFVQSPLIDFLTMKETNPKAIEKLKDQLRWSLLFLSLLEIGRASNLIYIAATRSAGDSKFTAIASIPITWFSAILIAFLLSRYAHLGWLGIVIGMTLDECLRGILNYWRWKSNKWKKYIGKIHDDKTIKNEIPRKIESEFHQEGIANKDGIY